MKKYSLMIAVLFIGTSALAQTPSGLSSQAQVVQTRDFVSGLINRISANSVDQFAVSADYARSGPALQARFGQALTRFKQTMDVLVQGPLASSIDRYNVLVRDESISEGEKKLRLTGMFQSLSIQVNAATSAYQAALAQLYLVEPSWVLQSVAVDRRGKITFTWFDGVKEKMGEFFYTSYFRSYPEYIGSEQSEFVNSAIHRHMKTTLFNACQSQACVSGMVAAYSAYLNDINQLVNQDLVIPLADGKSITVRCLTSNKGWGRYNGLINAVASYQFDQDYLQLPFSVKGAE